MSDREAPLWLPPRRAKSLDVLGIGENSIDRVCVVRALPALGAKVSLLGYSEGPGGQVATAMVGCARLGLTAAYAGAVGDDAAADQVLAPLLEAGVDITQVRRVAGAPTRLGVILVEQGSGERTVLEFRDSKLATASANLSRAQIERARVLELDMSDPDASRWAARVARGADTAVVLDVDRSSEALRALLPDVDFPIVSEGFAETTRKGETPLGALRELSAHGARLAVVTLGARGAVGRVGETVIESPAFSVRAVDTTGAGDAFRAGFIWGLLRGLGPVAVLRAANGAAGLNCGALGAQGGLPTVQALQTICLQPAGETRPAERSG